MQLTILAEAKKTQRNFHHAREFFLKTMLASIVLLSLVVFQKSNPPCYLKRCLTLQNIRKEK